MIECITYKVFCACSISRKVNNSIAVADERVSWLHSIHHTEGVTNEVFLLFLLLFVVRASLNWRSSIFVEAHVGVASQLYRWILVALDDCIHTQNSMAMRYKSARVNNQEPTPVLGFKDIYIYIFDMERTLHAHFLHRMSLFIYIEWKRSLIFECGRSIMHFEFGMQKFQESLVLMLSESLIYCNFGQPRNDWKCAKSTTNCISNRIASNKRLKWLYYLNLYVNLDWFLMSWYFEHEEDKLFVDGKFMNGLRISYTHSNRQMHSNCRNCASSN